MNPDIRFTFFILKTKFFEIKEEEEEEDDDNNNAKQKKKFLNRRTKLTDEEIREERRRLQERAMKMTETKTTTKHVHFNDNEMDIDFNHEEIPNEQFRKIFIHHTKMDSLPVGDSSSALFSHPGAIGHNQPIAFTGKTIEREVTTPIEPPKRMSKFKASRQ